MKFAEVMAHYDYKMINLVKALKVARQTVANWKMRDAIPFDKQCQLQVMTENKLIADMAHSGDENE